MRGSAARRSCSLSPPHPPMAVATGPSLSRKGRGLLGRCTAHAAACVVDAGLAPLPLVGRGWGWGSSCNERPAVLEQTVIHATAARRGPAGIPSETPHPRPLPTRGEGFRRLDDGRRRQGLTRPLMDAAISCAATLLGGCHGISIRCVSWLYYHAYGRRRQVRCNITPLLFLRDSKRSPRGSQLLPD